jgi:hypothetical protein
MGKKRTSQGSRMMGNDVAFSIPRIDFIYSTRIVHIDQSLSMAYHWQQCLVLGNGNDSTIYDASSSMCGASSSTCPHHRHKEYYIFIYIPILYWYLHHVQKLRTILVVIGKARTASFPSLLKLKQTYNQITTSLLSLAPQSTSLYLWKSI